MALMCCWCVEEPEKEYELPIATQRKICRLKLNWFYIIVISILVAFCSSSPNPTLRAYLTNPTVVELAQFNVTADDVQFEPGLGQSETFFIWSNLALNIGSVCGALLGAVLATFIPYWYSILFSLLIHLMGSLLYATAVNGPIMIVARSFAGVFIGLQTTLSYAYFGQSYECYIKLHKEAGVSEEDIRDKCRIKNILFTLFTVVTYLGYFFGEVPSAVFSRFTMDHYRAIGWCNLVLGGLIVLLLPVVFRGEMAFQCFKYFKETCRWKEPMTKSTFYVPITVAFLIVCSAVINTRMAIHKVLFPAILSDSFGVVGRVKEHISLALLVAPLFGGALILFLQAKHIRNIFISVCGMFLSIIGIILLIDWQTIPHDTCTSHSIYHNPRIILNYTQPSVLIENVNDITHQRCWNETQDSDFEAALPTGSNLLVSIDPVCVEMAEDEADCNLSFHPDKGFCSVRLPHHLGLNITSEEICLLDEDDYYLSDLTPTVGVRCTIENNVSCISACLERSATSDIQDVPTSAADTESMESLFSSTIAQSWNAVLKTIYDYAQEVCESDVEHRCHWIPQSIITSELCYSCPPICRGRDRMISLAQFFLGAVWFMITAPIAEVALPLVISDSVKSQYQGIVMGLTVMGIAVFRCITPLWLQSAYGTAQKRTFLPLLIMIATFLPFLFGLLLLIVFPVLPQLQVVSRTQGDEGAPDEKNSKPVLQDEKEASDSEDDEPGSQQTLEMTSLIKSPADS